MTKAKQGACVFSVGSSKKKKKGMSKRAVRGSRNSPNEGRLRILQAGGRPKVKGGAYKILEATGEEKIGAWERKNASHRVYRYKPPRVL